MSNAGYTPVFGTMLTGSLYGRWPHTGVWACLMSRVSREGLIDEHPGALAAAMGIPIEDLKRCLEDFMAPDSESRSTECDGRRLVLIDPARAWGWRVVNHSKYREKARKKAYDEERTASGIDASRKRAERGSAADVPTRPDVSRSQSHSQKHTQIQTQEGEARARPDVSREVPPSDEVSRGTIDAGDALTRSLSAEEALAEVQNAWRDVEGVDHQAMNAWLAHWSRVHAAREMPSHQRIATAKLLVGLGDADTQRRAVQTAEANGWKALRHGDGRAPPKSKADQASDARKESERMEWANLRERAERIGFRMPTADIDLVGYRTLLERAEHNQPRGGSKPIAKLLGRRA